jgi:hypothetical protein
MSRPPRFGSVLTELACAFMALAAPTLCSACIQISTGTESDAGSAATSSDAGTTSSGDSSVTSTGVSCGTDQATGVTLCLGTTACPNATLDTSAFPNCGFHPQGNSAFDLECLCDGNELCPIGVPNSCDDVATLLMQQQSALQVCEQVSTGGCLGLDAGGGSGSGSGSSSGGSTTLSSACQTCISGCGGTPSCYQACGC